MRIPDLIAWLEQLREALKADRKKAGILTTLLALLVVLWCRLLFVGGSPRPALGSTAPVQILPVVAAAPHKSLGSATLSAFAAAPIDEPDHNPFALQIDYFPQDGSKPPASPKTVGDNLWSRLGKSVASQADQRKERQILVANLQTQAGQLQLQSTLMGNKPKAMVNGSLLGEGDNVAGFRVVGIETRRIIVERDGIRLEIKMR